VSSVFNGVIAKYHLSFSGLKYSSKPEENIDEFQSEIKLAKLLQILW
jgi:hypothetical protein